MKNGTIIGFRILVDTEGLLVTEHIELPDEDIPKVFKEKENQLLVRIAKKSFKEITEDIHNRIENEIAAINTVCR
jgi:hypothetical protein